MSARGDAKRNDSESGVFMARHIGRQTAALSAPVRITAGAAVGGRMEGEGPLRACFDELCRDSYFGQKSWEAAESVMLRRCFDRLCEKAAVSPAALHYLLSGDLQSQCTGSTFALRESGVPLLGLYGACATMGEAMGLGALLIDGGAADAVCALTSSHFCAAERQFRQPLEYGGQRTPTAQRTATAAGAVLLRRGGTGPRITHVTTGVIVDAGVTDAANMGAAMAPAACRIAPYRRRPGGRQTAARCRAFQYTKRHGKEEYSRRPARLRRRHKKGFPLSSGGSPSPRLCLRSPRKTPGSPRRSSRICGSA